MSQTIKEISPGDWSQYYHEIQRNRHSLRPYWGRKNLLHNLPIGTLDAVRILDVGCSSGFNLRQLARLYPNAELVGFDIQEHLLKKAERRMKGYTDSVTLRKAFYGQPTSTFEGVFDVILFSYTLSTAPSFWERMLQQALKDLRDGGLIAIVDTCKPTNNPLLNRMQRKYILQNEGLLTSITPDWKEEFFSIKKAPANLWQYVQYIGRKVV